MRKRQLPPMPGIDARADQVAERLRSLADPVRLRLLGVLRHGSCPVGHLASALGIGQPLVSFHLDALERAGLVATERGGRLTYARIAPAGVHGLLRQVTELLGLDPSPARHPDPGWPEAVDQVVRELHARFDPLLGAARVERLARDGAAQLRHGDAGAVTRQLLATHLAQQLRAVARAERRVPRQVPEVLFVCVHNAARSQMAAALVNRFAAGRVQAWSAGTRPAAQIRQEAVEVMAELGIDLGESVPKPWTNEVVRAVDVVVAIGCGEDLPRFPGVRYVTWAVPDPAGLPLAQVRRIRDQLAEQVRALLDELTDPHHAGASPG